MAPMASSKFKMRLILSLATMLIMLSTQAQAKEADCKTTMKGKKAEMQYCTKFGVAAHETLTIGVNSRVLNAPHLFVSSNQAKDVKYEIAVFADQDYDQFKSKTTCTEKRKAATKLITVVTPVDGNWS